MLLILSKDKSTEVLRAIGRVLKQDPELDVEVIDLSVASGLVQGLSMFSKPPKAILALGTQSLEWFQQQGLAPKNRKITGLRKSVFNLNGIPVLFSYSVGIADVDYAQYTDMLTDVALAMRMARTGSLKPKYGHYEYVKDLAGVVSDIEKLLEERGAVDLAFDTETLGLDRFHPDAYLISLQFSYEPGTAKVLAFGSKAHSLSVLKEFQTQEHLGWLLSDPRIKLCAANGKYDIEWVYEQTGIETTNFTFDTTMVGSLLDENRSNGLDVHAKIYVPALGGYSDEFDQKADKSRMDLEYAKDPHGFLLYAGGDPDATLQVKHAQKAELLEDDQLTSFYVNIMHPAIRAFEQVERGGVVVDIDEYQMLEDDLNKSLDQHTAEAKKVIGGILTAKHYDPDKRGGLNLTKASLITDYMFSPQGLNLKPKMVTEKDKKPSTAMEHLQMFKDVPEAAEFVKLLGLYSVASKTLNTYVTGFKKFIRSDGRMHPTYWLFAGNKEEDEGGTNTGRLSVRDPAFQTIPKHTTWGKRIRRVFKAPPGHLVLECDYSQGELRVIACLANEDTMIEAYAKNMDLHVITSGTVAGYTYDEMMAMKKSDKAKYDSIRQLGKAGNFGLIYGMGTDGFVDYARINYKVVMPWEEADEFRTGFFRTYPKLLTYHEVYKAFARKHGYVRSPLGRVRHLPLINSGRRDIQSKAERQAINSPVQGALSDMMIWAIALQVRHGWHQESPCFGAIHDAGYYYIPEDNHEFYARRTVQVMENLPFEQVGWTPQLKFPADAKVGPNMADLKELSL